MPLLPLPARRGGLLVVAALLASACQNDTPKPSASSAAASAPAPSAAASADPKAAHTAEARRITRKFGGALKRALTEGLSDGGPKNAVNVCHTKAPAVAKSIELEPGWSVRRTALKLRNPDNAPDDWERTVLEGFEAKRKAGKALGELEEAAIVGGEFRYMKAIGTAGICLTCHGTNVSPEVAGVIDEHYPKDQARGFAVGDVRGAFSLRKAL